MKLHRFNLIACAIAAAALPMSRNAHAFGDEGHEVVALIAEHFLQPEVRHKVFAILAGDTSHLTASHDMAAEATWADRYRDSTPARHQQTGKWHFVDIDIKSPDLDAACFQHLPLPAATPASAGPPHSCVVDKIDQFEHELAAPATPKDERRMALQFLLHFVGDVHQPLHASNDHDFGGNSKLAQAQGLPRGKLHHYWDAVFVEAIADGGAPSVAQQLIAGIDASQQQAWASGSAADWARESFEASRDFSYGKLPKPKQGVYQLGKTYVHGATALTSLQLSKAGVRLATLLNRALGAAQPGAAPP